MSKWRHSDLGWTAQEERRFRAAEPVARLMARPVEEMHALGERCAVLAAEAKGLHTAHLRASGGLSDRAHVAVAGSCLEWQRAMAWWAYTLAAIVEWRCAPVDRWPAQLAVFAGVQSKSYATPSNTVIEYAGQCLVRDGAGVLWCGRGGAARGTAEVIFSQGRITWSRLDGRGQPVEVAREVTP